MHISVDIETAGSRDSARILQISAVAFELNGSVQEPHELLRDKDRWFDASVMYPPADQPTVDATNVAFWEAPEQARAFELINARSPEYIGYALGGLAFFVARWLGKRGGIWAKPPQFDLRILGAHYAAYEIPRPWEQKQEHDVRTLMWLAKKAPRAGFRLPDTSGAGLVPHFALHDAVRQAVVAQAAYRALALGVSDSMLARPKGEANGLDVEQGRNS